MYEAATVYLDHNVVVYLRNESSEELSSKVKIHKDMGFKFLFSPAHLEEIAVSQMRTGAKQEVVDRDIDFLTALCGRNSIRPVSHERVELSSEYPWECYARVVGGYERNDIAEHIEKKFLSNVHNKFKSDPRKVNNLNPVDIFNETIVNRELLLLGLEKAGFINQSEALACLQSWSFKTLHSKFSVREHAVNMLANWLEMIGYNREPESNSRSRMHDVSHIIYASYADLIVSNDRKLREKAVAIYSILEMPTKVLKLDEYLSL